MDMMPSWTCDPELLIRRGIEDNSKTIFSYFALKTYVVTPQQNRLNKMVLMMGHNICFDEEIQIIIPKLSLLTLIWSTGEHNHFSYLYFPQHTELHIKYGFNLPSGLGGEDA